MSPERAALPLRHALALGALHGPAELLPVSSSAHVALVPQLLGWPSATLPPELRKSLEVMLHTGSLVALLAVERPLAPWPALLATVPAAAVGLLLEGPIEQRLGGPRATAAGLLLGSAVLLLCDARGGTDREAGGLTNGDALALGLAQAAALVPGVSRLGLTVSVARARGFGRPTAFSLGRRAGLPVLAGATLLKGVRLVRDPPPRDVRAALATGAVAALVSGIAAAPLRHTTPVRAVALERAALAVAALRLARTRR
ncbi:MAG TPA: undecaprenyl-diphosphate phosphatase [Baekduia sp.]|jgi:undecaprenyl-diphosphatase